MPALSLLLPILGASSRAGAQPPPELGVPFSADPVVAGRSPGPGTTIVDVDEVEWQVPPTAPPGSFEVAPIIGSFLRPGFYVCYARWHPGWMSAPHSYLFDRHSIMVSGTWTVGAGTRIDLAATIPMTAGQYALRKAGTPHYDGALTDATEPAVFVLFGNGPAVPIPVDPGSPAVLKL
ncbi:hypothetical protein [Nocardia sp. NPDC057030]|uniref:hypothetical protein n=1 Tax=unclassified Nocardia TaxID=2637762 RepID=UPI00363372C3